MTCIHRCRWYLQLIDYNYNKSILILETSFCLFFTSSSSKEKNAILQSSFHVYIHPAGLVDLSTTNIFDITGAPVLIPRNFAGLPLGEAHGKHGRGGTPLSCRALFVYNKLKAGTR